MNDALQQGEVTELRSRSQDIDEPLVSVCCTTYQHVNFIRDAIEGFVGQRTNFSVEIIIRDDASIDGTAQVVAEYAARYPAIIRPILNKENMFRKGVRPMLDCLSYARGKYIALCEGDDYWTDPLKLQKQVDFLQRDNSISLCAHLVNKLQNEVFMVDSFLPGRYTLQHIITSGRIGHTVSYVFRNYFQTPWGEAALTLYNNPRLLVLGGDRLLLLLLGLKGNFHVLPDYMAVYRKHSGGVTLTADFQANYMIGGYYLLKEFDLFTNSAYHDQIRPAKLFWLKMVITRDNSLKNKVVAWKESLNLGFKLWLQFGFILPYYAGKAFFYNKFKVAKRKGW